MKKQGIQQRMEKILKLYKKACPALKNKLDKEYRALVVELIKLEQTAA